MNEVTPPPPIAPPVLEPEEEPIELVPLDGIPFPPVIKLFAAITVLTFLVALTRVPHAFGEGMHYERGHKALEQQHFVEAATELKPVLDEYPEAKEVRMDLIRAYMGANELDRAVQTIMWFEGKKVSKDEEAELQTLESTLGSRLGVEGDSNL